MTNKLKNMNRTLKTIILSILALSLYACQDKNDTKPVEIQLEVNSNNISGKWELSDWNGQAPAGGTYVYLDIVRNDGTYSMYQNMDTAKPRLITGSYSIEMDQELGAVIHGSYDHDSGLWSHRYIVKSLTSDRMEWVAKDDVSFTQIYKRVSSIPVAE